MDGSQRPLVYVDWLYLKDYDNVIYGFGVWLPVTVVCKVMDLVVQALNNSKSFFKVRYLEKVFGNVFLQPEDVEDVEVDDGSSFLPFSSYLDDLTDRDPVMKTEAVNTLNRVSLYLFCSFMYTRFSVYCASL